MMLDVGVCQATAQPSPALYTTIPLTSTVTVSGGAELIFAS